MRESVARQLPSVHAVVEALADLDGRYPRELVTREARAQVQAAREELSAGSAPQTPDIAARVRRALEEIARPSLRQVINATGVVLHTNLGRAPLEELGTWEGYSNLEYDLAAGQRGRRDTHVAALLGKLLGVGAIAVNNNAAAVYLALHELAAGGEAIVSRGELIEIGDGFRIPDIMAHSGAVLREVGTTNRTRIEDYREAIHERTRLILVVHRSNFRMQGFTGKPSRGEIAQLAREAGVPLYEDLGSGCLADPAMLGVEEPRPQDALRDGASLVSFSCDKLLGGPQAGILAGRAELVARLRRNPMFRALRLDKLVLGALENTLRATLLETWDKIPALRMIRLQPEAIRERANVLAASLPGAAVIEGKSLIGGGSTPEQTLATWLVAVRHPKIADVECRLRENSPAVVARMEDGVLLVDLRTVRSEEEAGLREALLRALRASG